MGWLRQLLPQLALAAATVAATADSSNGTDSAVRIHIEATVIPGTAENEEETAEEGLSSGTLIGTWLSELTDTWWKTALWGLAAALLFLLYFYFTRQGNKSIFSRFERLVPYFLESVPGSAYQS